MRVLGSIFLKVEHLNKDNDFILKPGDGLFVKVDDEFILGELCAIVINDEEKSIIVKSKNNMNVYSLSDITWFFKKLYSDFKCISIHEKLFIIDDFDHDPISINEECLLLEPSIDPIKKYNIYKAVVETINHEFVRFKIRYKGDKQSVEVEAGISAKDSHKFLIKKIKDGEYK